jgi:uncharacterized protein (TIGR03503 family)
VDLGNGAADHASVESLRDPLVRDFREKGIQIYCVAYSPQADWALLDYLARATGGLCARGERDEDLQRLFLRFFEELAQPQTVPLRDNQVLIDSGVREATFFIDHAEGAKGIRLVRPGGKGFSHADAPSGSRWFSAPQYDLVTVAEPEAGRWRVERPASSQDDRVVLLTDLELTPGDLPAMVLAGEELPLTACLADKGRAIQTAEVTQHTTVTARLRPGDSGEVALFDDGAYGDSAAGDASFAGTISVPLDAGRYDLEISAVAPTFERRVMRSFTVLPRWFDVQVEKDAIQTGEPVRLSIAVRPGLDFPAEAFGFRAVAVLPDGSRAEAKAAARAPLKYSIVLNETPVTGAYIVTVTGSLAYAKDRSLEARVGPLDIAVHKARPVPLALPPREQAAAPTPEHPAVKAPAGGKEERRYFWLELGISALLLIVAATMAFILWRRRNPPAPASLSMEHLLEPAAAIRQGQATPEAAGGGAAPPAAPEEPASPSISDKAGEAEDKPSAPAPQADALNAPLDEPTGEGDKTSRGQEPPFGSMPDVLVEISDEDAQREPIERPKTQEPEDHREELAPAREEVIEELTPDEENLLAEVLKDVSTGSPQPPSEPPAAEHTGETPDIAEVLGLEDEEPADEEPADEQQPAPPRPQSGPTRELRKADKDLLAEIAGEAAPAEQEPRKDSNEGPPAAELNDGLPDIPDENDSRSDDEMIDDILNQTGKITKT